MNIKFICFLALISLIVSKNPPKITIYVESLCMDTAKFGSTIFRDLITSPYKDMLYSSFNIIPYGNAKEADNSSPDNRSFVCQHGDQECFGNYIENCAFSFLQEDQDKYERFFFCFEDHINFYQFKVDFTQALKNCINPEIANIVLDCANSATGRELHYQSGLRTGPHNAYVPYFFVGGKHSDEIQNGMQYDALNFLCKYNDLVGKIPICKP